MLPPQTPADLEAVETGQHHVEQHEVEVRERGHGQRVLTGGGDLDHVATLGEPAAEKVSHLGLVLDDQHPHTLIVGTWMRG